MKPITHYLTDQQIARLRAESARTGLTLAELIRRAIDVFLPPLPGVRIRHVNKPTSSEDKP